MGTAVSEKFMATIYPDNRLQCTSGISHWEDLTLKTEPMSGPNVFFDDSGNQISFADGARELFDLWKTLLENLTGKVYL